MPTTEEIHAVLAVLTKKHLSRLRFYWQNRRHPPANQGTVHDLDLFRMGLIVPAKDSHDNYAVTDLAVAVLAAHSEAVRAQQAPHHEMGGRVAQWLQSKGRMTWEAIEFSVENNDVSKSAKALDIDVSRICGVLHAHPRPDVFSIELSLKERWLEPQVHEVKVSRADFLADVNNPLKRLAYAQISEKVFYVVPAGMVKKEEAPARCGLIYEHSPGEFEIVVKAKKLAVALTPSHYLNMVLKPGTFPPTKAV